MLDIVTALTVFKEVLEAVTNTATRITPTPKKKVVRELLSVSETLEDCEETIREVLSCVEKYLQEEQVGMRVHHLHNLGKHLTELQNLFNAFWFWADKGKSVPGIKTFSPGSMEQLRRLDVISMLVMGEGQNAAFGGNQQMQSLWAIERVASQIEAVRSPSPEKFPQHEIMKEFRHSMENLLAETQKSKEKLRKFVTKNFTLEDMFS